MAEKSKANLGQRINGRLFFSNEEKHLIIQDYLSGNQTKQQVYFRYTGYKHEHGNLVDWMRQLGYQCNTKTGNLAVMGSKEDDKGSRPVPIEDLQLKKRIGELEEQLKEAELKVIAFSTMVDIAEKEFNVPIRKKYSTKPLKK